MKGGIRLKKATVLLSVLIFVLMFIIPTNVNAENVSVYDEVGVLSEETVDCIEQANLKLSEMNHAPRLVIAFIKNVEAKDMSDKVETMFDELQLSRDEYSYDVLICFNIEQKKYDIERGGAYLLDDAFLINQDLMVGLIDENVNAMLIDGKYDEVAIKITKQFEDMMQKQNDGVYAEREITRQKNTTILKIVFFVGGIITIIAIIIYYKKHPLQNKSDARKDEKNENHGNC